MSTSLQMLPRNSTPQTTVYGPWARGRFALRVEGAGPEYERPVEVRRPYALIGRAPGADIVLDDHVIAPRHVYLHLDRRGLFGVDLATHTGSVIGPLGLSAAWLRPGEAIEVAGYRVEVAALHLDDPDLAGPGVADPLCDITGDERPRLTLYPDGGGTPLVLNSELVFAGRSEACGVRAEGPGVAPVQCVLVRGEAGAYVVDFLGQATRINGRPLRTPAPLRDGDVLHVGASRFECRVQGGLEGTVAPWRAPDDEQAAPAPRAAELSLAPTPSYPAELLARRAAPNHLPSLPGLGLEPNGEVQALMGWMMGALQMTHDDLLRRQSVFQRDVMRALRRIHSQSVGHGRQLERLESLNNEVAALRDEVKRRYASAEPPRQATPPRALQGLSVSPLPTPENLIDDTDAWLSRRVHQISQENQAVRRASLKK